jgi:hypothetical protein
MPLIFNTQKVNHIKFVSLFMTYIPQLNSTSYLQSFKIVIIKQINKYTFCLIAILSCHIIKNDLNKNSVFSGRPPHEISESHN